MSTETEQGNWYTKARFIQGGEHVFALTDIIMNSGDFTGVVIYGLQRVGKTMYSLEVMYDIYRDWNKVLKYTFFRLEELVSSLRNEIKRGNKVDVLLFDDAGVYASKYLFFSNKKLTEYLQNLFDVIGTAVQGLIITTPNPENLLKSIRGYEFYRVKIFKTGSATRIAKGYQTVMLPSGKKIIRRAFDDHYNVKVPDNIYREYNKIRKSYMDVALDNLDEVLENNSEK